MAQIVLNGASLHCDDVVRFAASDVKVSVDPASLDSPAEAAWKLQREAVARRAVLRADHRSRGQQDCPYGRQR